MKPITYSSFHRSCHGSVLILIVRCTKRSPVKKLTKLNAA